jgi:hypothetical protein
MVNFMKEIKSILMTVLRLYFPQQFAYVNTSIME